MENSSLPFCFCLLVVYTPPGAPSLSALLVKLQQTDRWQNHGNAKTGLLRTLCVMARFFEAAQPKKSESSMRPNVLCAELESFGHGFSEWHRRAVDHESATLEADQPHEPF